MPKKRKNHNKIKLKPQNVVQRTTFKSWFKRIRDHWVISALVGVSVLVGTYSGIKQIYEDFLKEEPVQNFSYTSLRLLTELRRLNQEYDRTGSSDSINRIVDLLVYNFQTLRLEKPKAFATTMSGIMFENTASFDQPGNWLPYNGLTLMQLQYVEGKVKSAKFEARIKHNDVEKPLPKVPFLFWWENQIVINDRLENQFTRKTLVMSYALYNSQKNYAGISNLEMIKEFNYLGINIEDNHYDSPLIDMKTLKPIRPKVPPPKALVNSLLNESIRAISGEVEVTLMNSQVR